MASLQQLIIALLSIRGEEEIQFMPPQFLMTFDASVGEEFSMSMARLQLVMVKPASKACRVSPEENWTPMEFVGAINVTSGPPVLITWAFLPLNRRVSR